jgi:DNA-binding GntR family transcriptional regulator
MNLHYYWTTKGARCSLKPQCTTEEQRRIKRWEHEAVLDAMQERLADRARALLIRIIRHGGRDHFGIGPDRCLGSHSRAL